MEPASSSAVLAEGDSVSQSFANCTVNNVGGNQVTTHQNIGQVNIYNVRKGNSESDFWWTQPTEKIDDATVADFRAKLNRRTWRSTEVAVVKSYQQENLSDPGFVVHPQIKTGFRLYQGDYVPEDGFVASAQPKTGHIVTFHELVDVFQQNTFRFHAIISQAGGGKSVLLKRLSRALIEQNGLSHNGDFGGILKRKNRKFDVVYHLNIKDISNDENISTPEALFHPTICDLSALEAQHGYQAVLEGKIKLIMILDGLDQANWTPEGDEKIGHWQKTSTSKIIGNLICGHILQDVCVVISSREHCIASLPASMRPDYTAALVGFTESDAKKLFCALMEKDGEKEWEKMRFTNPGLIYMSSVPLFSIFNVIVRKLNPNDPPDCVSGVMTRIIEILLRTQHFRQHDKIVEIINCLKTLAFHGTKNKTVVFSAEDLEKIGLTFEEVSDIVIKVPGSNNLSEKLLSGDYLYIFGHQTLQEILSAYFVCEMKFLDFENFVGEEIRKSHWSVVTTFLCGILKNEAVWKRISPSILNVENRQEKCQCLLQNLQSRLKTHSPVQRLDILVALREANTFEVFKNNMSSLNFSNFPLTTSVIHTLCSLLQHVKKIPYLSLANCGIDDKLFDILVSQTQGLGIQIDTLDLTANTISSDDSIWRTFFHEVKIRQCFISCPISKECRHLNIESLVEIACAATANQVQELYFHNINRFPVNGVVAKRLNQTVSGGKVKDMVVISCHQKTSLLSWVGEKLHPTTSSDLIQEARRELEEEMKLVRKANPNLSNDSLTQHDWKEIGVLSQRYLAEEIQVPFPSDLSQIHFLLSRVTNMKFQCLVLHEGRNVPCTSIRLSDRRVCLKVLEKEDDDQVRYADIIVDVGMLPPKEVGHIIKKCNFEAVLVAEWPKFKASSFATGLNGKKIKRLAVNILDNKIADFLRQYKLTENLFINKKIHDESTCRGYSRKMKVTVLDPAFWEESFCMWW